MAKRVSIPPPFDFPLKPHRRVHGPKGYPKYGLYKDWLRDEFAFRCVYCLSRERWGGNDGYKGFQIDHVIPKSSHPEYETCYDNLVYCCRRCNNLKSTISKIPDPCEESFATHLKLSETGEFDALTSDGELMIDHLKLNEKTRVDERRLSLLIHAANSIYPEEVLRLRFGYPDLPDLSKQKPPPDGNRRPRGLRRSHFARHKAGKLPPYY
jgi:HNH endonuclease